MKGTRRRCSPPITRVESLWPSQPKRETAVQIRDAKKLLCQHSALITADNGASLISSDWETLSSILDSWCRQENGTFSQRLRHCEHKNYQEGRDVSEQHGYFRSFLVEATAKTCKRACYSSEVLCTAGLTSNVFCHGNKIVGHMCICI